MIISLLSINTFGQCIYSTILYQIINPAAKSGKGYALYIYIYIYIY